VDPALRGGTMTRSRTVWTIAGLDLAVFLLTSLRSSDGGVAAVILFVVGLASFVGVGALLCSRVPENPIGPLLLGAGTILVISIVIGEYADIGKTQQPPWPGWLVARIACDVTFVIPFFLAFIAVPLVFPDGRLASPRFRWIVGLAVVDLAAWTIINVLVDSTGLPRDPSVEFLAPVAAVLQTFFLVASVTCFLGAVVAVSLRFRRGDSVQREQVKWLAADVGIAAVLLTTSIALATSNPVVSSTLSGFAIIAMFALPIVIGIAILRYRLYAIDRIISRTIGWGIVTGVLIAVFAGLVVALEAVLAPVTRESTLAVAASTLVAFALFQPVRRRVQRAVDRRFDRARYDGQRMVDAFAEHLRSEVDLGILRSSLSATATRAVRPASAVVWLRTVQPSPIPPRS
jgi:hypothetical protein